MRSAVRGATLAALIVSTVVLAACAKGAPDPVPQESEGSQVPADLSEGEQEAPAPEDTWRDIDPESFPPMVSLEDYESPVPGTGMFNIAVEDSSPHATCLIADSEASCLLIDGGWELCRLYQLASFVSLTSDGGTQFDPQNCPGEGIPAADTPALLQEWDRFSWGNVTCSYIQSTLRCEREGGDQFFVLGPDGSIETRPVVDDSISVPGFPEVIQGVWKTSQEAHATEGFSLFLLAQQYPALELEAINPDTPAPGATTYSICLEPGCAMASMVFVAHFPAGVEWDCLRDGADVASGQGCDPDFTSSHDTSEPRITVLPNHQHNEDYLDSEPLYLY